MRAIGCRGGSISWRSAVRCNSTNRRPAPDPRTSAVSSARTCSRRGIIDTGTDPQLLVRYCAARTGPRADLHLLTSRPPAGRHPGRYIASSSPIIRVARLTTGDPTDLRSWRPKPEVTGPGPEADPSDMHRRPLGGGRTLAARARPHRRRISTAWWRVGVRPASALSGPPRWQRNIVFLVGVATWPWSHPYAAATDRPGVSSGRSLGCWRSSGARSRGGWSICS